MNNCIRKIFIIMPAYNAGKTIEATFQRIPNNIHSRINQYVVVNDGSSDDTLLALERLKSLFNNLVVLQHSTNRGYGAAEKTLLRYAREHDADCAVLLHADGQYAPEKIETLLDPICRGEVELVQGSRMLGGGALQGKMPLYKYLANRALSKIQNIFFNLNLAEYHSGFMVYSKRVIEEIPVEHLSDSFDIDVEILLCTHLLGMRIREVAIPTRYADEVSHLRPIRYGLDILGIVFKCLTGKYNRLLELHKRVEI
jgi:glycosyltransferase involved in cell wall biosynthesis